MQNTRRHSRTERDGSEGNCVAAVGPAGKAPPLRLVVFKYDLGIFDIFWKKKAALERFKAGQSSKKVLDVVVSPKLVLSYQALIILEHDCLGGFSRLIAKTES